MIPATLAAIGVGDISVRLNHRGLFNRFLARVGVAEQSAAILRLVDKLEKIGRQAVLDGLTELVGASKAENVLGFIEARGSFETILGFMTEASGGPSPESAPLALLRKFMLDSDQSASFVLDPSITRGLDYYTGIVYETFLNDMPDIGSICSGGRYDNLAGLYSKEALGGVGSSIGLDRLIAALEALGKLTPKPSYTQVAIACVDEQSAGRYQHIADRFRQAGLCCEVFFTADKLTKQYMLAEKKGASWLVIPAGDGEALTVRDLAHRENHECQSAEEAVGLVSLHLG